MATRQLASAVLGVLLIAACRSRQETTYRDTSNGSVDTSAARVVVGKDDSAARDTTRTHLKEMMTAMEIELKALDTAKVATIQAQLPEHVSAATRLVNRLDDDMLHMNKADVPEWRTLVDSLRRDLIRLPQLTTSDLPSYMTQHRARLTRLMELESANMR